MKKEDKIIIGILFGGLTVYAFSLIKKETTNTGIGQYDVSDKDTKPAIQTFLKRIRENNVLMYIEQACNHIKSLNSESGKKFVMAIVMRESSGIADPVQYGKAGEIGLMQITKGAFSEVENRYNYGFKYPDDLRNPFKNILVGCTYLDYLALKFGIENKWELLANSYNGGNPTNPNASAYAKMIVRTMKDFS